MAKKKATKSVSVSPVKSATVNARALQALGLSKEQVAGLKVLFGGSAPAPTAPEDKHVGKLVGVNAKGEFSSAALQEAADAVHAAFAMLARAQVKSPDPFIAARAKKLADYCEATDENHVDRDTLRKLIRTAYDIFLGRDTTGRS